jgi:hypothetical protein
MHLLVRRIEETEAREDDDDPLLIVGAEVRLTTLAGDTLAFDERTPNPFMVVSDATLEPLDGEPQDAIARVDAISTVHAAQLSAFVDQRIIAEARLFGATLRNGRFTVRPFSYPIELCEGCLTRCRSGTTTQECPGLAGADGTTCIGEDC